MTNALFISDTSDGGNWGCYATSSELRAILNDRVDIVNTVFLNEINITNREFILPSQYDIRYIVGESINSISEENGIIRKLYNSSRNGHHLFELLPKTASQFEHRAEKFVESGLVNDYFGNTENIDHIIINGEGSIHDSGVTKYSNGSWSLLFLAYVAKKKLGMKTHIINHTLEINTDRFRSIVNLVYPLMNSIIFRDPVSMTEYESQSKHKNGTQAADAAWLMDNDIQSKNINNFNDMNIISLWHPNKKNPKFDFTKPYICVGGGSGLQQSIDVKSKKFALLVNEMKTRFPDMNILLTAASSADETFLLNVAENTETCLLKTNNNHHLTASILGHSEVYIGGRWHESIFALLGKSQLVNFSGNTFKIEALREHIGSNHPIYSENDIGTNTNAILDSVENGIRRGFYNEIPIENMRSLASKNANIV
ncbi:polysaccharide pyruvyl transferase family protein [Halopenitus persicus]|uniref:polysaccharide pyruvyl transferase family protein n=1 Tax=Halopenitus persicus TaxID=1048396 RepID=UPI000BBA4A02|nr:polysaccharide pyruvyl transferase family protein [Halopenitus persicus]